MEYKRIELCVLRNADGSYTEMTYENLLRLYDYRSRFFITLGSFLLEVSEQAYRDFQRAERRERYLQEKTQGIGGFITLEHDFPDHTVDVEETSVNEIMLEQLLAALYELPQKELALIYALYFEGKTERQLSDETGIPRKTINDRRRKILGKLHKLLENQK
ncbi:MAG: sigma-70 family RNA polymerase sigma factor [Oscillospiraceae bacterium]|nr:sigma-70 family RNA polymerase sigma factor [Oscillospiraceae bacterium]